MPTPNPNFLTALPGISGILVTPFDRDDRIAPERLQPIIDRAVEGRRSHPDRERQHGRVLRADHGRGDGGWCMRSPR